MRTLTLCLFLALFAAPAAAQDRLPILDMHLHAFTADHLGPPPRAMCTPMPFPAWDPSRPYHELFDELAKEPPCPDPVWSPNTDKELMTQTIEVMERLNIVGVLSGLEPDRVATWRAAAPGRFIPGLVLEFDDAGGAFSVDSLRSLHAAGRLAVLGEVVNQYAGIAPDDERMEPYWALAEELDIPVGIHVGTGPPGAIYLGDEVLAREKFDDYLTLEERAAFIEALVERSRFADPTEDVQACRDPDDDKFLELAVSENATCIVSGDSDLLELGPFRGVPIMKPADFLEWSKQNR